MRNKLNNNDKALLHQIQQHRYLTTRQAIALDHRNPGVVRRRLKQLVECGELITSRRQQVGRPGQPEQVYQIKATSEETIPGTKKSAAPLWPKHLEHEILLTWVCIQCGVIPDLLNEVSAQCERYWTRQDRVPRTWSFTPCNMTHADHRRLGKRPPQEISLIPDASLTLSTESNSGLAHFFIEVDMGTETLVGRPSRRNDITQKLLNYRGLFRHCKERSAGPAPDFASQHLEKGSPAARLDSIHERGFRVLFVASTPERADALAKWARNHTPSAFIWITDASKLHLRGIWSPIWRSGGKGTLSSILGSYAKPFM